MGNRYVYSEEEKLPIAKRQCDLCLNKTDENYGCAIFSQAPQDVLNNTVKCKAIKPKGISYPWDEQYATGHSQMGD